MNQSARPFSILLLLPLLALACARNDNSSLEFNANSDNGSLGQVSPAPAPTPTAPGTVVCDPFAAGNIISATSGLRGAIYALPANQPQYSTSADMIAHGDKVDVDLFLSQVNVPTREFSTGFAGEEGEPIKDTSGHVLNEWFALSLESKLKLSSQDAAGSYQLAVLADDGATLNLQTPWGTNEAIVQNEGAHATQMACATQTITMGATTRVPISLTYFQGPRYHIALVVMWRKIDPTLNRSIADEECGRGGNDYFFRVGTQTAPAVPLTPYQNLLARGWKPLSAENFELQSGSNRCSL